MLGTAPDPPHAAAEPRASWRRRWVRLPTAVGAVLALVCLGFVAATMASEWAEVRDRIADAAPGWLVLAVLSAAGAMTWIAWCWEDALGLVGHRPGRRRVIAWYYSGEIGKYVPPAEVARLEQYVFVPMNLNKATAEAFMTIPRMTQRMVHEFEEYRPYTSFDQFRREIGKYVDEKEVARFERYLTIE